MMMIYIDFKKISHVDIRYFWGYSSFYPSLSIDFFPNNCMKIMGLVMFSWPFNLCVLFNAKAILEEEH